MEDVDLTDNCFKYHPFCRIIVSNLNARIESLEKQLQDKKSIIEIALGQI